MGMALVFSFLYLLPRNYSPRLAAAILWALFVNAYFAGHSLFQVTLVRYGEVIVPLLPLLLGLILWAIGEWAVSKWQQRKSNRQRVHPATPEHVVPVA
jgi:Flp pilus assembly protein protease CpaA